MKKTTSLITGLFVMIATVSAQNIELSIGRNCQVTAKLNNENLVKNKQKTIAVTKGGKLNIIVAGLSDNPEFIVSLIDNKNVNITLDNRALPTGQAITVNDQLQATIGEQTLDLSKDFSLVAGCSNLDASLVRYTLKPDVQEDTSNRGPKRFDGNTPKTEVYNPGSAVYDALKLSNDHGMTESEFIKIIRLYFSDDIDDLNKAMNAIKDKPFLKDLKFNPEKDKVTVAEATGSIFSGLSLSSIGGLDVTSISDALARVLVKRTKQELNALFFEKFKKLLDDYRYRDLKTLFPSTYIILTAMGEEIYDYEKYIQNLRESFKSDMTILDETLPGIIPNHQAFFTTNHALAASLKTACYVAGELKRQVHPGDILDNYPLEFLDAETRNWKGAVQTLQLLSTSMRDTTTTDSTYWVNIKYLRQLVNNKRAFKIYFGLVYQLAVRNYDNVAFEQKHLTDVLLVLAGNYDEYYDEYKRYIFQFAERTETLNRMIRNYQKLATDSLALEQYKKYFDAVVDLIKQSAAVGTLPVARNVMFLADLPQKLSFSFNIQQAVSDLVIEINRKNYPAAINKVVIVYDMVKTRKRTGEALAVNQPGAAIIAPIKDEPTEKDKGSSKQKLFAKRTVVVEEEDDVMQKLVRYGGFMSAIALAKSSQEIEEILETFALPVGSSRIKRASPFNVSLNAYVGLFTGYEKIKGIDDKFSFNSFGVAAPIGLAISRGNSILFIKGDHGASSSLFLSLVDIGALTAFRFKDDETEKVPTVNLKNIISPGVFYSLGFGKTPLSLNFGYQIGPLLRKIDPLVATLHENSYTRISLSLNVDIPLFNFYNKSK